MKEWSLRHNVKSPISCEQVARISNVTYHLPIKVYIWLFSVCTFFSLLKVIRKKKKKMESPLVIRIDKNEFKPGRSITQDGGAGEIPSNQFRRDK